MSKEITETWSEFLERYQNLVFVRTKKQIYTADEIDDNIIKEEDTLPLMKGKTQVIPLDETAYPRCFKTGSAMELGIWAISVCEKNKLEVRPSVIWEILKKQEEILAKTEE
jgi:hypothetical protein